MTTWLADVRRAAASSAVVAVLAMGCAHRVPSHLEQEMVVVVPYALARGHRRCESHPVEITRAREESDMQLLTDPAQVRQRYTVRVCGAALDLVLRCVLSRPQQCLADNWPQPRLYPFEEDAAAFGTAAAAVPAELSLAFECRNGPISLRFRSADSRVIDGEREWHFEVERCDHRWNVQVRCRRDDLRCAPIAFSNIE